MKVASLYNNCFRVFPSLSFQVVCDTTTIINFILITLERHVSKCVLKPALITIYIIAAGHSFKFSSDSAEDDVCKI